MTSSFRFKVLLVAQEEVAPLYQGDITVTVKIPRLPHSVITEIG
jgi:hypothetical protein